MEHKKEKARGLVYILLEIMRATAEKLNEDENFSQLSQEKKDDIWMEFLFFNLHQFNRTFFAWLGRQERDELMDAVVIELNEYMKAVIADGAKEAHDNLSSDNFENYIEIARFQNYLKDFVDIYNERETEYAQYSDNPKKGNGFAGTLIWEFGKKISKTMDREYDVEAIMIMQLLGSSFTYFREAMEELIKTGKIRDQDFKKKGEE